MIKIMHSGLMKTGYFFDKSKENDKNKKNRADFLPWQGTS